MEASLLPEIPPERADDLHAMDRAARADLVLFMAGNQFMVMEELLAAFRAVHPAVRAISYETLPPGLELKQIMAGGARFRGQVLTAYPDVYASVSQDAMARLAAAGHIERAAARCYLHNRLSLMVAAGNPARVRGVADLGRDALRVSQPDPANEDIGCHIVQMYRDAGGDALVTRIMAQKRAAGTTIFTRVHHRETPQHIAQGTADVGPVWATEIVAARRAGRALEAVEPGAALDQRDRVNYYVAPTVRARNTANAAKFIDFLRSPAAGAIFRQHGFLPPAH
jgi:molybdate transport system substrate-binding protein